jgi:hypothetical protein
MKFGDSHGAYGNSLAAGGAIVININEVSGGNEGLIALGPAKLQSSFILRFSDYRFYDMPLFKMLFGHKHSLDIRRLFRTLIGKMYYKSLR